MVRSKLLPLLLGAGLVLAPEIDGAWARSPDCTVLARLAGSWIGRGSLQRYLVSGAEPVRCRLVTTWAAAPRVLTQRLDCRGIDGEISFAGSIGVTGPDGGLSGSLTGSQGLDRGELIGWCEPAGLELRLTGHNPTTGAPVQGHLVISLPDGGDTLVQTLEARDPETGTLFPALSLTFAR